MSLFDAGDDVSLQAHLDFMKIIILIMIQVLNSILIVLFWVVQIICTKKNEINLRQIFDKYQNWLIFFIK